jgi:hypothetical protein
MNGMNRAKVDFVKGEQKPLIIDIQQMFVGCDK